ncbi:hypothetical protein ACOMHN_014308 [Nucella lapillus]
MTSEQNGHGDVTVVIDVGTRHFRGGIAGKDGPACEITTATPEKDRDPESSEYAMTRGCVKDWERVEALIHAVYSHMHVQHDTHHNLLFTRHVHAPASDAERFVQVGVESMGASAVYLGVQPVLTLYANGGTDGVVLDCGEGVTQVVPIYQGYGVDHAVRRQDLAGRDVSAALQTLLDNRKPDAVHVNIETAREIKERICFVAPTSDPEAEVSRTKVTRSYTLPNGANISVGEERHRAPEVLFQPSLIGSEGLGLPALLHKSVSACPIDVRSSMYERIIMAGGTTRMPGICRRLLKEVSALAPKCRVKVVAGAGRQHSAWRGGSVLASLPSFPQMCVSRQEYEEQGAVIVRKKFLWT